MGNSGKEPCRESWEKRSPAQRVSNSSMQPTPHPVPSVAKAGEAHGDPDPGPGDPGAVPGHPALGDREPGEGMWSGDHFPGGGPGRRLPPGSGGEQEAGRTAGAAPG